MKTKHKVLFALVLFFCAFLNLNAQKITGYLPSYRTVTPVTSVQYDKLTDIVFAFINPNTSGNLITYVLNPSSAEFDFEMSKFLEVKAHCKANNVRLHIAIGGADGGGLRDARLFSVCGSAGTRSTLVSELVQFSIAHELAGIDVDWEFPNTFDKRTAHQNLLAELRTAINASSRPDLLLSVAVGGEYPSVTSPNHVDYFNAAAVGYPDIFYIMAYDLPTAYGTNHSSLTSSTSSMDTWNTAKGVPKSKMQLGVPFYGRNSTRTLIQEYRDLAGASPVSVFGADSYLYSGNTYYYNGSATLQSKVDMVNTQCGEGIMIWDLGEDRTDAYSLLGAINSRMTTNCNFIPNLGADKSVCGASTILDCGLLAAGKTFSWKRNGTPIAGSSPTLTANQSGLYEVTVVEGCCKKTDKVEVLLITTVTGTGATRCGSGVVNLAVTSGAGTYDWYSTSTAGSKLATGLTYAPSITSNTTYHVQRNYGNKTYSGGREYNSPANCWTDRWQDEEGPAGYPEWAQQITVSSTITIESLKIWRANANINNVTVKIYGPDGYALEAATTPVNLPSIAGASTTSPLVNTLAVNITLEPGTYFIGVIAPTTSTGLYMLSNSAGPFVASTVANVFSIAPNTYRNFGFGFTGATVHYGTLFDLKISTPIASACARTAIVGTINCNPTATLVSPAPPGPVSHTVNTSLSLSSTASDDGTVASLSYVIRRTSDNGIVATVAGGAAPSYTASWTPTIVQDYTVTAVATDNLGLTGASTPVTVTIALPIELISFSGKENGRINVLEWITGSEYNNSYFEIGRAGAELKFSTIGKIKGSGNSSSNNHYTFTDESPVLGENYYRLVQYDFDGSNSKSNMILLSNESSQVCFVSRNPFLNTTTLTMKGLSEASVAIIDVKGQVVSTLLIEKRVEEIEIGAALDPGIYQLKVNAGKYVYVVKIVKL